MTDDEQGSDATLAEPVDRRDFLNTTWKVLGVALVVEAGWTSYDILNPKPAAGFGGTVDAGPVEDFLTASARSSRSARTWAARSEIARRREPRPASGARATEARTT